MEDDQNECTKGHEKPVRIQNRREYELSERRRSPSITQEKMAGEGGVHMESIRRLQDLPFGLNS
ncbi:MAG: hypothetical protein M3164_05860 [Actinomycetota bacterium]|nr:hypothetical protein [Actinomycetota bacterium]